MAQTFYAQNLKLLQFNKDYQVAEKQTDYDGNNYNSVYIGSFMSMDPCGRYHCMISPNGITSRCESYWESLDKAAIKLGGWIESGEGDPTDIFFCWPISE